MNYHYQGSIRRTLQNLFWTTHRNRKPGSPFTRRTADKSVPSRPSQLAFQRKLERYLRRSHFGR